ncbi:MAG: hypothetical protein R3A45_10625 [Bdellovibrionota bacterium]
MRVIPKTPVVEEISSKESIPMFSPDESIDGTADQSLFEIDGEVLAESKLEANIDLDEKRLQAAGESSEITYVSEIITPAKQEEISQITEVERKDTIKPPEIEEDSSPEDDFYQTKKSLLIPSICSIPNQAWMMQMQQKSLIQTTRTILSIDLVRPLKHKYLQKKRYLR